MFAFLGLLITEHVIFLLKFKYIQVSLSQTFSIRKQSKHLFMALQVLLPLASTCHSASPHLIMLLHPLVLSTESCSGYLNMPDMCCDSRSLQTFFLLPEILRDMLMAPFPICSKALLNCLLLSKACPDHTAKILGPPPISGSPFSALDSVMLVTFRLYHWLTYLTYICFPLNLM